MHDSSSSPEPINVGILPGDGIGPELMDSAIQVLTAACEKHGRAIRTHSIDGGADTYRRTGLAVADGTLDRVRRLDGLLKGPVGDPDVRHPDGTEAGLLGGILRQGLDTYANVRPVKLHPGVPSPVKFEPADIDYVIVRENTEGLYLSRGRGVRTADAASDQLMMTRNGVRRVATFAFQLARRRHGAPVDGVPTVTCVDKANVLSSFAFFREIFDEVATEYPDVRANHRYSDAAAYELVAAPWNFDVVVTENFLGDLLSDLGAATAGGLGMAPSANIGDNAAYFEPIHGSAPTLAGADLANPTSQILSAALLLEHLGHYGPATSIRNAVHRAFAEGACELNGAGQVTTGTSAATRAVIELLD